MSHWASVRSFGCFIYFENSTNVPARSLLEAVVGELGVEAEAKISTKNYALRWKNFRWKAIDEAIASDDTLSIAMLVGTPADVRLGGKTGLRLDPAFEDVWQPPRLAWVGAESERWPEPVFTQLARRWLRVAAEQGTPLSGGVLAASDLRNAKMEMTQEFESSDGEQDHDRSPKSFTGRLMAERSPKETKEKIRRVYPITLLGPKFASHVDDSKLAGAGATNIERVNRSVLFDATPQLLEAWSPEYLAATVELRRLLWPLSFQNRADDPEADGKGRR
jgi:hypothetical protein